MSMQDFADWITPWETGHEQSQREGKEADMMAAMQRAAQAYAAYRPQLAQNHMNALRNVQGLYQPSADMMAEMSGGRFAPDLGWMSRNPVQTTGLGRDMAYPKPMTREEYVNNARTVLKDNPFGRDLERKVVNKYGTQQQKDRLAVDDIKEEPIIGRKYGKRLEDEYEKKYGKGK